MEIAADLEPPGYDPERKFIYFRSQEYSVKYTAPIELKHLTLAHVDRHFIDLSQFPNLKTIHIIHSNLDSLVFPKNNQLEEIWIDDLKLKSNLID